MVKRNFFVRYLGHAAVAAVLFSGISYAQDAPTPTELLKESLQLMEAGKYDEAVDAMYMYLGAVEESRAPRVVAIAQDIRFKMASVLIKADRLDEAAAVLQTYIEMPLGENRRKAMNMLSSCYYEIEAYEDCVDATTNAIAYNEDPQAFIEKLAAKLAQTSRGDEDDEDDDADEDDPFAEEAVAEEEPYTQDELTMLHLTLGESYYALESWSECIDPFTYVIETTDNEQRKGYGIMQIINALIEIPDFARITEWIPQLYRTSARYDIRVNLALMNAAAALYDAGEYDSALPLYRMILPRDVMIEYQSERLRKMRIAEGLPPEMDAEMTADEMLLFGVEEEPADASAQGGATVVSEDDGKSKELRELENLIETLKGLPPYETDINYRMALIYKEVERWWEALQFYEMVYAVDPDSDIGERSIYDIVSTLLDNLDEPEEAKIKGFDYLSGHSEGMMPRQIAYLFTGYHQQRQQMPAVKELLPYLDTFVRTNDTTIVKYDTELYYMQAVADLVMQNYESAEKSFMRILEEFPSNHQEGNCIYWLGMSRLFLQKYKEAAEPFATYVKKFPTGDWVDEALFQGGVCMFGMEQYAEAKDRFGYVIETYPNSSVLPECCSMRGDIFGSEGLLDEAVADYEKAVANAKKVSQATYPVFQMAAIYEAEDKNEPIIEAVQAYIDQWGEEADIAKALFWIGKTRINQGKVPEAVETYVNAIVKFGSNVRQDGVDLMIAELVKVSKIWLDTEAQDSLKSDLKSAMIATEDPTLKLRLRVAMAMIDGEEIELGKTLIKELPNLDYASPPVLAVICDASFEMEDYSRAEEMLKIFQLQFEESEYKRAAFKLLGYGLYTAKDYEAALATIEEAQETYGTDHDVAWAQLMKAQIYYDMQDYDRAREENLNVLNVPAWRGAPVAQATYQLGQVNEAEGKLLTACGFYQRTYFQYKGHAGGHWAAEAYLASARCLKKLGRENDMRNTYRAFLFDRFVNTLPQADVAREALGAAEAEEIATLLEGGLVTNITVEVETEALTTTASGKPKAEEAAAETPPEILETEPPAETNAAATELEGEM